jgi:ATP-binding cassette subfamily B protein
MKKIKHTQQHDQSDCGVACLRSVLRYFDSDASVERLWEMSGIPFSGAAALAGRGLLHSAPGRSHSHY